MTTAPGEPAKARDPGFGQATATFVVVSSMIGTGVLTTSGFTVFYVGSNQLMLMLWVIGGLVAICGALSLAELSAMMPRTGGDYVFMTEAYGPLAGFLSGWVSFLIGFGGPIALSARAAAKYVIKPMGLADRGGLVESLLATAAILAFAAVHASGRSRTIRVQGSMTIVKLAILGTLAVAGIAAGWGRWANLDDRPPMTREVLLAMASSFVYIAYAYTGWNGASYLAGEVEDPQRRLPRAILLGTALVTALYLALNLAYALALPAEEIRRIVADSPAEKLEDKVNAVAPIAQIAAMRLRGPRIAGPLSVAIGLTLLASVSAYVLTGPRVAFAMARAGQFPEIAGRLSPRWGTPAIATGLQVAWALVLLWAAPLEKILAYAGLGLAIFSMLTVSAVYVLRWRRPDLPRPFRTPGYPIVPAIYLVMTGLLVAAVIRDRPELSAYSVGSIVAGVPIYYLWAWRKAKAAGPTRE